MEMEKKNFDNFNKGKSFLRQGIAKTGTLPDLLDTDTTKKDQNEFRKTFELPNLVPIKIEVGF